MRIELETTRDGVNWQWEQLNTLAEYHGEPYALTLGSVVISFYSSLSAANKARDSLDNQMYLVGHIARLFGFGPVVTQVRRIVTNVEITTEDYKNANN